MSNAPRPYRTPNRVPPRRPPAPRRQSYGLSPRRGSGCGLVIVALIALVCVGGVYLYINVFSTLATISRGEDVRPTSIAGGGPPPAVIREPFTMLIIGVDLREDHPDDGARSDTLIVVHVDPRDKWASMLSIPRDTLVQIPSEWCEGASGNKINAAYSCGFQHPQIYGLGTSLENRQDAGAALAAQTVADFLGIKIDYTAQVDFTGFERIVDALGGVTIDVERTILDAEYPTEDYGYMRLYIPAGLQRMDGATALRYARTRHVDNDFGRAQRQQQVLQAILAEVKNQGILGQIESAPRLLQVAGESVRTTLKLNDISTLRGLANLALEIGPDRIQRFALKPETMPDGSPNIIGDAWSFINWRPDYVRSVVQQAMTPPAPPSASSPATEQPAPLAVQVQNGTLIRGLAAQISVDLDVCGYEVLPAADAPEKGIPNTLILAYNGQRALAEELAGYFGVAPQFIVDVTDEPAPPGVGVIVRLGDDYQPPTCTRGRS